MLLRWRGTCADNRRTGEVRMTTAAENEFLTRIGPGTPMGALLRQYWLPPCLSSQLVADGDPVRLALLGEKLIAFRDSAGQIGVLRSSLPASLRLAVLRPQRGMRAALRLSRLEVRHRRQLPRHAQFAGAIRICATRSRHGPIARPSATGSSMSIWASAPRRRRCRRSRRS